MPLTQFSLFGAEAQSPHLADLDGLLFAGGQWVRARGGARLSVVVADRWRADAIHDAFTELAVGATTDEAVIPSSAESGWGVRTAFADDLLPRAQRWTRGSRRGVPADLVLTAGGLRLWAVAGGRPDEAGYRLRCVAADDPLHAVAGAQLARLGVAAVSLGHGGGSAWRVTSARRQRRLDELVGPPPPGAGSDWVDPVR